MNNTNEINFMPLFSGSKGNSSFVECNGTKILVDAGVTRAKIQKKLQSVGVELAEINAVILTHGHVDHTKGLDILLKHTNCDVYLKENCKNSIMDKLWQYESRLKVVSESFSIGEIKVTPFDLPHDSPCTGFVFQSQERKFSYLTDLGMCEENVVNLIKGSNKVYIESNHDENMVRCGAYPYPLKMRILSKNGHLSNEACADVCKVLYENGTDKFILGHLSEENNLPELAYNVTYKKLKGQNPKADFKLYVVQRDGLDMFL